MIWRICGWSDGLKLNGGEVYYQSTWSNVCYLFSVPQIAFRLLFKCGSLWGLFWLDDARLYPEKFLGGKQGDFSGDGSGIRVLSKGSGNHFPPCPITAVSLVSTKSVLKNQNCRLFICVCVHFYVHLEAFLEKSLLIAGWYPGWKYVTWEFCFSVL